jgi:hypothetical protein
MANINQPTGFTPIGDASGANWSGKVNAYVIDLGNSTATFVGDLVTAAGNATAIVSPSAYAGYNLPRVIQSAASDTAIVGAVVAFEMDRTKPGTLSPYRVASTTRVCLVSDDPMTLYVVQSNGASGTVASKTTYNYHVDASTNTGNTTTGVSGMLIDDSNPATTSTFEIKALRPLYRQDNTPNAQYNKVVVMLNNCFFKAGTAGV